MRRTSLAIAGVLLVFGSTHAATLEPGPSSAEAWLRRASLDLTGRLPSTSQLTRLRQSPTDRTRAALADELLASPGYPRRWGRLLAAPLVTADRELNTLARRVEDHLSGALARREGWDQAVRELLTAEGSVDEAPATAFLLQFIEARAEVASRLGTGLMGVRMACAQCHDHPFARWTVKDFHGLAAWFARTRRLDLPRELYQIYRAGRQADLSQIDIALPPTSKQKITREQLERIGRQFALLNRHKIGGPPRASAPAASRSSCSPPPGTGWRAHGSRT